MNVLAELKSRFESTVSQYTEDVTALLGMIRPSQDTKFGDYQANFAMPLGKKVGKPPREIAGDIVEQVELSGLCESAEVAGPGFFNLTLDSEWLNSSLKSALRDERLDVAHVAEPRTYVVDFSSPNVAKPMHVGHIRSTVIGNAISNILRFAGHSVITDNHLGDWGTQFGMIIYGYKHFLEPEQYESQPIQELGRLYKLVRKVMDFHDAKSRLPAVEEALKTQQSALEQLESKTIEDAKLAKKHKKEVRRLKEKVKVQQELAGDLATKIATTENDPEQAALFNQHPDIGTAVLNETAKLHDGDSENRELWEQFLPVCRQDIQRIYARLGIKFDYELGESFYHPHLKEVVDDFVAKGLARESDGAMCVFLEDYETPMIIQKQDGAFLYSTTDLATIKYRMETWKADASLYVVDHRQHEHFEKLFDAARLWGYPDAELVHVSFGTVMGPDGRPYKTRSGDTVGLEGLLDEAESRALEIATEVNPELTPEKLARIANVVGIGGLKYADLSHNRSSDYVFSYDKMLALKGNTATYLQYGYARVQGIIRKVVGESPEEIERFLSNVQSSPNDFEFQEDVERQMGLQILRFAESIDDVLVEYKPNLLCSYLYELAQTFGSFFEKCSVKNAESESLKQSRIQLCVLTARTLRLGLSLLGIEVLDRM